MEVLVSPQRKPSSVYRRPILPGGAPLAAKGNNPTAAVLDEINTVRTQAKLAPVALSPEESAVVLRLAPRYFGAVLGDDKSGVQDLIALGLSAGWSVAGTVRLGRLTSVFTEESDARRLTALSSRGGPALP